MRVQGVWEGNEAGFSSPSSCPISRFAGAYSPAVIKSCLILFCRIITENKGEGGEEEDR